MKTKQNDPYSDDEQELNDVEFALYCDGMEEQYKEAKEDSFFEILKVLDLDREHSDAKLVQAIDYFKSKNGVVESDAPMDFLTERAKKIVHRDGGFRPGLYCMLLSQSFSEAIDNESVFLEYSLKFAFDKSE